MKKSRQQVVQEIQNLTEAVKPLLQPETYLDKFTGQPHKSYPCAVCGVEMGWDKPSGVCSQACLEKGQGFAPNAKLGE
jgi:hypothetical protein